MIVFFEGLRHIDVQSSSWFFVLLGNQLVQLPLFVGRARSSFLYTTSLVTSVALLVRLQAPLSRTFQVACTQRPLGSHVLSIEIPKALFQLGRLLDRLARDFLQHQKFLQLTQPRQIRRRVL